MFGPFCSSEFTPRNCVALSVKELSTWRIRLILLLLEVVKPLLQLWFLTLCSALITLSCHSPAVTPLLHAPCADIPSQRHIWLPTCASSRQLARQAHRPRPRSGRTALRRLPRCASPSLPRCPPPPRSRSWLRLLARTRTQRPYHRVHPRQRTGRLVDPEFRRISEGQRLRL